MASILFQIILLFLFWVALSGILDPFHLTVGLLGALGIALLNRSSQKNPLSLVQLASRSVGIVLYSLWLLKSIFVAAVHVSKLILGPKEALSPKFIEHKTSLKGDGTKTLFANSITLTPGTITADIQGDKLTIHRIDHSSSGDIESGHMEKQIKKIFGGRSK